MCLIETKFCGGHVCTCVCILVTLQTCHIDVLVGDFFLSEFYLVLFDNFWFLDTSRKDKLPPFKEET